MQEISLIDPYTVSYKGIYAVCDAKNEYAEIIEHTNCFSEQLGLSTITQKLPLS